jgi:hypothetical protein
LLLKKRFNFINFYYSKLRILISGAIIFSKFRYLSKNIFKPMKSILILFSITLSLFSLSQTNTMSNNVKRNSLYLEIGGQSIFYSLNYDKLFLIKEIIQTSFTVGASIVPKNTFCDFGISTPISYNFILGKSSHKFVVGIGLTPFYLKRHIIDEISSMYDYQGFMNYGGQISTYNINYLAKEFYIYFTPKLGYRYQKKEEGLFIKADLTPLLAGYFFQEKLREGYGIGLSRTVTSTYFNNVPFNSKSVQFWAGVSLGWTFKR